MKDTLNINSIPNGISSNQSNGMSIPVYSSIVRYSYLFVGDSLTHKGQILFGGLNYGAHEVRLYDDNTWDIDKGNRFQPWRVLTDAIVDIVVGTQTTHAHRASAPPQVPGITTPPAKWKFDVMDIVEVGGEDYKVINKVLAGLGPEYYELMRMSDGHKSTMSKDTFERFGVIGPRLRYNPSPTPWPSDPIVRTTESRQPNGHVWTNAKDVAYENRCRHTQTKLNHAGGIVFKQCCHCKEDLGDA